MATWKCPHGCKGDVICEHLEELIGSADAGRDSRVTYTGHLERLEPQMAWDLVSEWSEEEEAEKMREKLKKFGVLKDREIEVIINRIVHNHTMPVIAKLCKYTDEKSANKAYTRAIAKLRKANYQ